MESDGSRDRFISQKRHRWWSVQILVVGDNFLRMLHFTSNMTEAYSLAKDLGQGPVWSGLLISSAWGLACFGALIGWRLAKLDHAWVCLVVTLCPWWSVFATSLYVIGANPPVNCFSNGLRMVLLLTSRFSYGLMASMQGVILGIVGARVTPAGGMVQFEVYKQCARTLGIGGGPLVSAALSCVAKQLGDSTVRTRSAFPGMAMVVLWIIFALGVWIGFPRDSNALDVLLRSKMQEDEAHMPSGPTKKKGADSYDDQKIFVDILGRRIPLRVLNARRCVVIAGSFYGVERSFIVSALESATSFILETEFGYNTIEAGLAVGSTFLAALPVVMILRMFNVSGGQGQDNSLLLKLCSKLACVASLALYVKAGPLILVADSLIFSTSYLASSITDGVALSYTVPGTLLCVENYMLADQVVQNTVARLCGPVVSRTLIGMGGGRASYATFQFCVTLSGCLVSTAITKCDAAIKKSRRSSLQSETGVELPSFG